MLNLENYPLTITLGFLTVILLPYITPVIPSFLGIYAFHKESIKDKVKDEIADDNLLNLDGSNISAESIDKAMLEPLEGVDNLTPTNRLLEVPENADLFVEDLDNLNQYINMLDNITSLPYHFNYDIPIYTES